MAEKKSIFKKLFTKREKDCCSVDIEEVKKEINYNESEKKSADKS